MKRFLAENIRELKPAGRIEGVRVGTIAEITDGQPLVDFSGNIQGPIPARYTRSIQLQLLQQAASSQQEVLLVFENNDPKRPIIIDTLHSLIDEITESPPMELQANESEDVTVDGKRITFDAKEQVELRCGKASIILTRAGKIIIRGAYLLNRSSGVNRIKGGSVQIN
ncbi:MAG: DUF6484 domain-containing protein [Thermodesulfobacteriota bacterium]|nr:DUF6484 domain-containing protein [Thermodesulfobacteriota bacterium]